MLDGKVTLVTGAGQGIGRAIALQMAAQGAAAVAVADRNHESVTETARLITAAGGEALALQCDVRERDQIAAMFADTTAAFGGLDVLANNAGVIETSLTSDCTIDTLPEEAWDTVYEINLKAVWLATKFAAPASPSIKARGEHRQHGLGGGDDRAARRAGLWHEQGRRRSAHKACCDRPGATDPLQLRLPGGDRDATGASVHRHRGGPRRAERSMLSTQLLDRMGRPEEVAKLVCYLASDDAGFITGAAFMIDGGALAWHGVRE